MILMFFFAFALISRYKASVAELARLVSGSHLLGAIKANSKQCPTGSTPLAYWAESDIRMEWVYDEISFNNLTTHERGWTQGFPISYDRQRVLGLEPTLEVVVMPHSHNDPGWLQTFEGYYTSEVKSILDNAGRFLAKLEDMHFEWAELSFLELWWRDSNASMREGLKRVVESGQLEILTGGWVMSDEANSHYFATIMQLLEGHEWLRNHLLVGPSAAAPPVSHWSIDPFGLSPTFAYLLHEAGLKQGVIQRTHYAVKAHLAARRQLEFRWRQSWAGASNTTDFLTHMMPFNSYDVSHTCGPDPEVCCQFDFYFADGNCYGLHGGIQVLKINSTNMVEMATMLADQFRKKAQLYKENVILVPWGMDSRYASEAEWRQQYYNLKKLFDYINSHTKDYNIHVRFGTLKHYFEVLRERLTKITAPENTTRRASMIEPQAGSKDSTPENHLPVLSGDFFTYADKEDHYWSGYFTSRPFHKHMDRTLQHYLRAADILFTVATNRRVHTETVVEKRSRELVNFYPQLVMARRALSLFQHHDGITGTAKPFVMGDYANKMLNAINSCLRVITRATAILLNIVDGNQPTQSMGQPPPQGSFPFFNSPHSFILTVDEVFDKVALPTLHVLPMRSELILFNPLGFERNEVICITVPFEGDGEKGVPRIYDTTGLPLHYQQIQPVVVLIDGVLTLASGRRKLCFLANLQALSFRTYYLDLQKGNTAGERGKPSYQAEVVRVLFKGDILISDAVTTYYKPERINPNDSTLISVANDEVLILIHPQTGYLQGLRPGKPGENPKQDDLRDVELSFVFYGVRSQRFGPTSGAYLFMPNGPAQPLPNSANNTYVLIDGPVQKSLVVKLGEPYHLLHTVELDIHSGGPTIRNLIDLSNHQNVEVAMRLKIAPELADFYTELNTYQFIRRRRHLDKLPIQAHVFPMPGAAFIQSERHRLSLMGRQALGVASFEPGWIEVLLDRRLIADDGLGLGEGVQDNRLTESRFSLLLEAFVSAEHQTTNSERGGDDMRQTAYHSFMAYHRSLQLHYPLIVQFMRESDHDFSQNTESRRRLEDISLLRQLPCDVHLVAMRTLSKATNYETAKVVDNGELVDFTSLPTEPRRTAALILHRVGVECRLPSGLEICGTNDSPISSSKDGIAVKELFWEGAVIVQPKRVAEAALTLLAVAKKDEGGWNVSELAIGPMEIKSWQLEF